MTSGNKRTARIGGLDLPEVPGYVPNFASCVDKLRSEDCVVEAKPAFVVNVGDVERLEFFIDEHDDGIAVLGGSERGSVLDHTELQAATPAVIYHAVTKADVECPEVLLSHHDGVAREFDLAPSDVALKSRSRGWLLTDIPNQLVGSPCANATFTKNICAHPEYDEAWCRKNTSGNWTYHVPGAYRYKAGFCLQKGQANSYLTYEHVRWNNSVGACESCNALHAGWGLRSLLFNEKYSATTYRVYVWWKSSASSWGRSFTHGGGYSAGDVFDFGQRYSWKPCNQFT